MIVNSLLDFIHKLSESIDIFLDLRFYVIGAGFKALFRALSLVSDRWPLLAKVAESVLSIRCWGVLASYGRVVAALGFGRRNWVWWSRLEFFFASGMVYIVGFGCWFLTAKTEEFWGRWSSLRRQFDRLSSLSKIMLSFHYLSLFLSFRVGILLPLWCQLFVNNRPRRVIRCWTLPQIRRKVLVILLLVKRIKWVLLRG
jgi:hypothetical protein